MGPVTAKLGEGDNALTFSAASVRLGALAVTTGPGMDVVTASGQEIILSALKAQLGAGNNSISSMGNNLTVGGVISVTTGAGDDSVAFSNVVQKTKGATLSLGDGLSQVSFAGSTVQMRGALTLQAGSHAAGTSSLLLNGVAALAVGAVNATFGNGDNTATISSNGPSKVASAKMIGGTGNDAMLISGTSRFFIGGSTFQGGNGTNNLSVLVTSGSVGAVKYTGGDEVDALVVQAALSPAGGVTAQMGAGNYIVNLIGGVQAKFAGPVNVSAQNTAAQVGNVFLTGATFAGVTINTGDGADTIQASDVIFGGSFSANTAGGNDLVNIETFTTGIPSVFRGPVTVLLGDGDDTLAVGVNTPTGHAEFKSKVKFDGGTGADTAHISAALFANIYLPGQPIALNFETKD
jgi:hypothetical protein